jgi:GTP-binding protein Era
MVEGGWDVNAGTTRCGYVALVGRANVGKSTLLNHLLGRKLSITSRKPQTTRHSLLGIHNTDDTQLLIVDTPGIQETAKKAIDRHMNRASLGMLADVDLVVMVIDRDHWTTADDYVLGQVQASRTRALCAINKVDRLEDKGRLLPLIERLHGHGIFDEIIPISALRRRNLEQLVGAISARMPESPPLFPEDQITDRDERFLVQEIVREKLVRQLGQELPYASTVLVESFKADDALAHIHAVIIVEREGQKPIIIGRGGQRLKLIGTEARRDIEALLERKVMLELWVKVRDSWADDEMALRQFGY